MKVEIYKPKVWLLLVDLLAISSNVLFVFYFLPLTSNDPFNKYAVAVSVFLITWVATSYFLKRYISLSKTGFFNSVFRLGITALILLGGFWGYILFNPTSGYSENVLITIIIGIVLSLYLFYFLFFAFKYATHYEVHTSERVDTDREIKEIDTGEIPSASFEKRKHRIIDIAGEKVYGFLDKNIDLTVESTFVMTAPEAIEDSIRYFDTCVQLIKLNQIRGINKMLLLMNHSLVNDGLIVCCYKSQASSKQRIFKRYPRGVADVIYFFHFLIHRVLPKVFLTNQLYYDFTGGKTRTLSKTEVLGRINYCGFKVERVAKVNQLHYVFARKITTPESIMSHRYGPLIKLKRFGKNGKVFNVYKFRTMHPYSEYLQEYIYEQSNLAEGGKFKRDIRVTTLGKFMRKYWLDELPMLYNLLKGDMKLVGVRPLSRHYFSLYSKELQQLRIKFKPGLLPPFYADMPKTLEEIEASELRYLYACEDTGSFKTDCKYFFLILRNILFRKARSA